MKTIDDFTTMAGLEALASDESVKVPGGLSDSIRYNLNALSFLEGEEPVKKRWTAGSISSIAAAIVILAGVGFGIAHVSNTPKDTFTDPYLAYAQLEETFSMISSKMDKGLSLAQEAEVMINKTNEIMKKIN